MERKPSAVASGMSTSMPLEDVVKNFPRDFAEARAMARATGWPKDAGGMALFIAPSSVGRVLEVL